MSYPWASRIINVTNDVTSASLPVDDHKNIDKILTVQTEYFTENDPVKKTTSNDRKAR